MNIEVSFNAGTSIIQACYDAKEEYMSEVAMIWEGKVDQRVVDSLKNWTVREND